MRRDRPFVEKPCRVVNNKDSRSEWHYRPFIDHVYRSHSYWPV